MEARIYEFMVVSEAANDPRMFVHQQIDVSSPYSVAEAYKFLRSVLKYGYKLVAVYHDGIPMYERS